MLCYAIFVSGCHGKCLEISKNVPKRFLICTTITQIIMADDKKSALFVCLGNICRSPIAEAVFMDEVKQAGQRDKWNIDSAGIIDKHAGEKPNHRARLTMAKHNLSYSNRARQIKEEDFNEFDYIFGMDNENINDLKKLAPVDSSAMILLLGDFDPEGQKIIKDPYFESGSDGFKKCYVQCVRSCKAFLVQAAEGRI